MKKRSRIVWKLSAVVIVIVTVVIILSGYVSNLIRAHYSLESARDVLKFNSESILHGIDKLMMSRNNAGVEELIIDISRGSGVYGDIRLMSHPSGTIVASRSGRSDRILKREDKPCAFCHDLDDPEHSSTEIRDEVLELPEGGRLLKVMAPILNEEKCKNAACHAHEDSPKILGLLETDYHLGNVDALIAGGNIDIAIAVLTALLLCTAALWVMFNYLLEKPIDSLIAGTKRIAKRDLDFRFRAERKDEFGLLEESFNDMTSRIQAHQSELRTAMEYLEGIVENSADIIITVNPEGRIQTFNTGAEQALGYRREEVIGKEIEILFVDPREREVAIAQLQSTDNVKNYETRFLTKSGKERNVLLTLSRLRDPQGNSIGTFGISKDITEEKRLIKQLVQSEKFAAIGQAVTGIQHAIKNMLNALKGGAYIVERGIAKNDRERLWEGWTMVEEGIARITGLSQNLLNYAKEWKPELERVDLGELVVKINGVIKQTASDRGVAVRADIPSDLPPVRCDPKLIHMAVMDIVTNAIDACAWKDYQPNETPEVVIRVYVDGSNYHSTIEVYDNGCGMSGEVVKNLFTPFFSTKKQWGTGLGLALTKRIINLHGGTITVESKPDQGSTFRIVLPVHGPSEKKGEG
ncbi:MAG: PAS domain S-box protein [Candidatus Latescibacteria bacterium]|nr:PAS domain S-box protein [Candidatus Latescibacterota bacterium]NIO55289.1 PAS domain S-box protein [Candidatus Latescibacterota bacterium]